jgi:hypothetical protein
MATRAQVERRGSRRFRLSLPVQTEHSEQGTLYAQTRDVSSRGICFYSPTNLAVGSTLTFTLTLPPEVTLSAPMRVQCISHVVRTEPQNGNPGVPVAAVIDHYDFLADEW